MQGLPSISQAIPLLQSNVIFSEAIGCAAFVIGKVKAVFAALSYGFAWASGPNGVASSSSGFAYSASGYALVLGPPQMLAIAVASLALRYLGRYLSRRLRCCKFLPKLCS